MIKDILKKYSHFLTRPLIHSFVIWPIRPLTLSLPQPLIHLPPTSHILTLTTHSSTLSILSPFFIPTHPLSEPIPHQLIHSLTLLHTYSVTHSFAHAHSPLSLSISLQHSSPFHPLNHSQSLSLIHNVQKLSAVPRCT